jgi:hypothetical protein
MRIRSVHTSMSSPVLAVLVLLASGGVAGCQRPGVSSGAVALNTSVGTVVAECLDTKYVRIDSTSPAGGYTATVVVEGPSSEASVRFVNPAATPVRVAIRCVDGQLRVEEFDDQDHPIPPENA